ncbi:zinc fyve domain containing protein [Apiospora aurea]|uniref:Zinc fyve domain containing protein n=1 Tax=Apiospora aurea TaxID=335848 RepID=A0ABR1QS06_9PEZI
MADPGSSDKTLLNRLNALKPTTVSLDKSATPMTATLSDDQPPSKEDALSERLKSLRGQATSQSAQHPGNAGPGADIPVPAPHLPSSSSGLSGAQPPPDNANLSTDIGRPAQNSAAASQGATQGTQDVETLLDTDDQTLEELLADLGSDEQWLEDMATEYANDEHQRISAMLDELGKPRAEGSRSTDSQHETDEDGSDAEPMAREADHVLAKAQDEVDWEKINTHNAESGPVQEFKSKKKSAPDATTPGGLNPDPFDLPTVPTDLQDPPEVPEIPHDDDFEAEIASRMAALKGLGGKDSSLPSVPSASIDDLGLPGVPTFAPGDRPVKGVYKRYGYTDEDQKSWCIVCLEDGAIRCIDCDDDIYCARCWKEMHVGLQAHYEDRGHRWEKYVKS